MSALVNLAESDAHRFRSDDDWFVLECNADLVTARVGATAERAVHSRRISPPPWTCT